MNISERLEIAFSHDAVTQALVFFTLAVCLGVAGYPLTQVRQRGPRLATEPVVPLDRKVFAIEFEPQDAAAGLVQQFGADVDFADFRSAKTRFQLDVPDNSVRLQQHVIPAAVDLALEHLDIASAVPPHEGEQLAEEQMTQRLLAQAGIGRMR